MTWRKRPRNRIISPAASSQSEIISQICGLKRRDLIRHPEAHGCRLRREGGRHSVYVNPATGATSAVPRHTEIYES